MIIVYSRNGVPIRLTEERWQHIIGRHPEMETQRAQVLETISKPELIQEGDFGELLAIRIYDDSPLTRKFLVVVYREVSSEDGFILTTYLTRQPSTRRRTVWSQ